MKITENSLFRLLKGVYFEQFSFLTPSDAHLVYKFPKSDHIIAHERGNNKGLFYSGQLLKCTT